MDVKRAKSKMEYIVAPTVLKENTKMVIHVVIAMMAAYLVIMVVLHLVMNAKMDIMRIKNGLVYIMIALVMNAVTKTQIVNYALEFVQIVDIANSNVQNARMGIIYLMVNVKNAIALANHAMELLRKIVSHA